jgi:hypothetical protein
MAEWKLAKGAPENTPVLVYNGEHMAVGRLMRHWWWIDESFGFNEDGEIPNVTHYMDLPAPPEGEEVSFGNP